MRISEVSEVTGFAPSTIRFYETKGLIRRVKRNSNGKRVYSKEDVSWIHFLGCLKKTRIPLTEMIEYADMFYSGRHSIPERVNLLKKHRIRLCGKLDEINESIELLDKKIDYYTDYIDG